MAASQARRRPARGRKPSARPAVPVDEQGSGRLARWAVGTLLAALAAVLLVALGLPGMIATEAGEALGRAGLVVRRVDVKGIQQMDQLPVYRIAFDQKSMAMPLVDVEGIRQRLLRYGWVADARVSRRFPDTLVIDIVERKPAALWQHRQQLHLIDAQGVVLERLSLDEMPDLPLLIGPGANSRSRDLERLLAAAPALKPQLASATWVGRRRWDLSFTSGETIALPEGERPAREALAKFAKLDSSTGILGRGLVRIDLRIPGKMVVRLPRAPGEAIAPPEESAT